jgi:hypothetical protein
VAVVAVGALFAGVPAVAVLDDGDVTGDATDLPLQQSLVGAPFRAAPGGAVPTGARSAVESGATRQSGQTPTPVSPGVSDSRR